VRKIAFYDAQTYSDSYRKMPEKKEEEHTFVEGEKKKLSTLLWNLKISLKMEPNQKKLKRLLITVVLFSIITNSQEMLNYLQFSINHMASLIPL